MNRLLTTPLLPQRKVQVVAVSGENNDVIIALHKLGIQTIIIEPNLKLDKPICSHADCVILQIDSNNIIIDESQINTFNEFFKNNIIKIDSKRLFVNYLTNRGDETKINFSKDSNINNNGFFINISDNNVQSPYPGDVSLNAKIVKNKILCNSKYLSSTVLNYAQSHNFEIIHCNQGYSACSSILLPDNSIITDDSSIKHSCESNGIISNDVSIGKIKLNGYDYGFIGGCCGMIDKNLLAFTGKLESHTDYKKILKVLNERNIKYINLTENELEDIGGIIPIIE